MLNRPTFACDCGDKLCPYSATITTIEGAPADAIVDEFRAECLHELDAIAHRPARRHGFKLAFGGATDAELPALFKALDAQLDNILARCNVRLG